MAMYLMKNRKNAFTLIELLVVIAIIAILAAILLSTLAIAKTRAQVTKARLEINAIVTAINGYDSDYGRFPTVQTTGGNDLTFGGQIKDAASGTLVNVGSVVG
ncbi:MAG TPA: prepilin-type N-terminal cleavage/methylation domain-containing protein, partial [Candidatus Baltobacteraceae bacterium]|nr:prepilin-type N-terminal cleavage/methylation domain-containing protein [Candidatus Baltobacteraceae bacterium]